jgi:hypothetical protein
MLETVRKTEDEVVLLEGLPLSEQTESFMRSADYFLQEGARASG